MFALIRLILTVSVFVRAINGEDSSQDTYLNALQDSHQTVASNSNAVNREDVNFHSNQPNGYNYQQPPVQQNYGYHYPAPVYGPPKPIYGPPPAHQFQGHQVFRPRDEHWFFDKFKFKLNLFTVGKILLKLIIFKKIVKFIGLVCLLLFIPKLKHLMPEGEEEDAGSMEESRTFNDNQVRLNEINSFAQTAIETFSRKYEGCERDEIWCRVQRMIDTVDKKYSYEKIAKLYLWNADVKDNTK